MKYSSGVNFVGQNFRLKNTNFQTTYPQDFRSNKNTCHVLTYFKQKLIKYCFYSVITSYTVLCLTNPTFQTFFYYSPSEAEFVEDVLQTLFSNCTAEKFLFLEPVTGITFYINVYFIWFQNEACNFTTDGDFIYQNELTFAIQQNQNQNLTEVMPTLRRGKTLKFPHCECRPIAVLDLLSKL